MIERKYILIECGDGNDPARIVICDTEESRNQETLKAIFGDGIDGSFTEEGKGCLETLKDCGELTFEGDPPLRWFEGEVVRTI